MRLDFFLSHPARARARARREGGARERPPGGGVRDASPSRDALGRRLLRRLGPSWEAAPIRRAVQALALGVFLLSFFWTLWPYTAVPTGGPQWPSHVADDLLAKEFLPAEGFLWLDPLVSLSSAIAARAWVVSLLGAAGILLVGVFIPRGFCGYLCPLGTLIDLFDATIGRRVSRFRVRPDGRWTGLKWLVLTAILASSLAGVLLSGFVAAIPVLTRGLVFVVDPIQTGLLRGWHQVPPVGWGHALSISLFALVLALGLLSPRFWCRYVCPTGAIFSLGNLLRLGERKVTSACVDCNRCVEACPFDAIAADYSTRASECAFCQTCGGACPTGAIRFAGRRDQVGEGPSVEPAPARAALTRRGFATAALSGVLLSFLVRRSRTAAAASAAAAVPIVRPPMSVPEEEFLRLCIRCEECLRACPNHVLWPQGLERGADGLWAPRVVADWSGCEPSCNNCSQVCPTGAIRPLPLQEKRWARMGLAIVDRSACLPWARREECRLCVEECTASGYRAMEFERIGVETDEAGAPVEGTGRLAPVVLEDRCVGCGLCQSACHRIRVRHDRKLERSAIVVAAGGGREDRLASGSYHALRQSEARRREEEARRREAELLEGWEDPGEDS